MEEVSKQSPESKHPDAAVDKESLGLGTAVQDLIEYHDVDPVLATKMTLLNQAINEIGWTGYHLKLFFLNGFGFAVDSLLTFLVGIANPQVVLEFNPPYPGGAQISLYVGMLFGALGKFSQPLLLRSASANALVWRLTMNAFWGLSADMIGRKWAFNLSLLFASVFSIIGGASPNFVAFASFNAIAAFGAGGNLVLDTTVFLEFLPSSKQYMIVVMALWWGIGQTVAALLAWAFMTNYSCPDADNCSQSNNMGWRYLYYTSGALVLVLSVLRITVLRFRETPKYLLVSGQDEEVISLLQDVAKKYDRPLSLTLEQLQQYGSVKGAHAKTSISPGEVGKHYKGLFSTRKLGISTSLLWLLWANIGLAYPLYYMFLPTYLASRGAEFGEDSPFITWRNYTITNFCAIFGPIFAGWLSTFPRIGRKYTMVTGALATMAFFFGYTAVSTAAQNLALNCAVSFTINIFFATLYAYTPEVLPAAHRGTGNGTAVSMARIMGIVAVVVGTHTDTSTPVPIYVCASLFVVIAIVAAVSPYEPQNGQSI